MSAFLYLAWTSARNRVWFQLRRARSPRYSVALVIAAVYIWAFLLRPSRSALGEIFLSRPAETIATLLMIIVLSGTWLFGSDKLALAFTQAEISLLFPAPLTRRALTGYKLYRAQIAVLINSLIWVFILRRGNAALPPAVRAIGIWTLFSTLNLHRLGAALVRSSWQEHGRAGARRNAWAILFFAAVAAAITAGLVVHRSELFPVRDSGAFFVALSDVLSKRPASFGLLPFRLVIAPAFAMTTAAWAWAMPGALGMLFAHVWWVLRADVAFEDAAIEASAERAKRLDAFRSRRSLGASTAPKRAGGSIALAAGGYPAHAIFWKNMLCLRRTAELRLLIGPLVMAIVIGAAVSEGMSDPALFVAAAAITFGGMLLVFGGRLIRNDLRHDMLNLALLKTLPVSARDLLLAEVASSALPMAALQTVLVVVAFVASLGTGGVPVPLQVRVGILVASPLAALALNGALLTIQNGLAVMFPAWMRLGSTVNTGVEALGQNLIATMANLVSLAFALVLPTAIAFIAVRYFMLAGGVATAATIVFASGALLGETWMVTRYLAAALGRAEPTAA